MALGRTGIATLDRSEQRIEKLKSRASERCIHNAVPKTSVSSAFVILDLWYVRGLIDTFLFTLLGWSNLFVVRGRSRQKRLGTSDRLLVFVFRKIWHPSVGNSLGFLAEVALCSESSFTRIRRVDFFY